MTRMFFLCALLSATAAWGQTQRMSYEESSAIKREMLPPGARMADFELDHIVPLCLNGSNERSNLQLQPWRGYEREDDRQVLQSALACIGSGAAFLFGFWRMVRAAFRDLGFGVWARGAALFVCGWLACVASGLWFLISLHRSTALFTALAHLSALFGANNPFFAVLPHSLGISV
jgi:hypothetical protein